jgi:hypothetical protein
MNFRLLAITFLFALSACATWAGTDTARTIFVSVPDQRLILVENGKTLAKYPISTSRFGMGDRWSSYRTPLGTLQVVQKIGANAPVGAVFKHRHLTGEILKPNAGGRDPIVTRIIWLSGTENCNQNAYQRGIYIHGTPVENLIGRPASYGCIRMRSQDVVNLFNAVPVGTKVTILDQPLRRIVSELRNQREFQSAKPAEVTRTAKATPSDAVKPTSLIARAD